MPGLKSVHVNKGAQDAELCTVYPIKYTHGFICASLYYYLSVDSYSADSRFSPSQWEMVLLCNHVSHWLDANLESTLFMWCIDLYSSQMDQIMAWCQFNSKLLPEPLLTFCQFNPQEQTSRKYESKYNRLHDENWKFIPLIAMCIQASIR